MAPNRNDNDAPGEAKGRRDPKVGRIGDEERAAVDRETERKIGPGEGKEPNGKRSETKAENEVQSPGIKLITI
jgi:hypothetical protein